VRSYPTRFSPARRRSLRTSSVPRREWRSRCVRGLLLKSSSPATRCPTAPGRPAAAREASATTSRRASAGGASGAQQDLQGNIEEEPAEARRNDEQDDEAD